ncbi:MAG: adenylate kinase [Oscillospiraceae bacterium]|nr:adenylate kinase [Oscillospiraceae bacterium]MDD4545781.1 adenylate kinase [Oscillospiraceae bacterium]
MKIIILGAPGAGKGTQADVISKHMQIPTISTGNIIREALKRGTEMGRKAKEYMESGRLVPDDVVIGIIRERLAQPDCEKGFILDGFPRTIPQAEALDRMGINIDRVINLEVDYEVIARRLSGRRVCSDCGATYHTVYNRPTVEGVCDRCGDTLIQRKDDHPDTVRERLRVYQEQTEPLKDYYTAQNKLFVVIGQEETADTTRLTLAALEAKD